jgi:hypothetical protein
MSMTFVSKGRGSLAGEGRRCPGAADLAGERVLSEDLSLPLAPGWIWPAAPRISRTAFVKNRLITINTRAKNLHHFRNCVPRYWLDTERTDGSIGRGGALYIAVWQHVLHASSGTGRKRDPHLRGQLQSLGGSCNGVRTSRNCPPRCRECESIWLVVGQIWLVLPKTPWRYILGRA